MKQAGRSGRRSSTSRPAPTSSARSRSRTASSGVHRLLPGEVRRVADPDPRGRDGWQPGAELRRPGAACRSRRTTSASTTRSRDRMPDRGATTEPAARAGHRATQAPAHGPVEVDDAAGARSCCAPEMGLPLITLLLGVYLVVRVPVLPAATEPAQHHRGGRGHRDRRRLRDRRRHRRRDRPDAGDRDDRGGDRRACTRCSSACRSAGRRPARCSRGGRRSGSSTAC